MGSSPIKTTMENNPERKPGESCRRPVISRLERHSLASLVLIILFFGLFLRVTRCFLVNRITKDGVLYVRMARGYDQGPRKQAFKRNRRMPPLYVELIALLHRTGISYETAAQSISVMAGTLMLIPFFLTARMLFGDRLALIAMLLAAVHPSLARNSSSIMRDPLFIFLLITAVCFMVGAARRKGLASHWRWLSGGAFAALAAATRGEGVELVAAMFLWIIIDLFLAYREKIPIGGILKRRAANSMVFVLAYILTTSAMVASVRGTDSTWGGFDSRTTSYMRGLLLRNSKEVIKEEDTL